MFNNATCFDSINGLNFPKITGHGIELFMIRPGEDFRGIIKIFFDKFSSLVLPAGQMRLLIIAAW